jgi:radical SAM protein with 4Fe4S-binding SPASM domain
MDTLSSPRHLQEPPFALQVELAEGCNLRCSFCGINGIRGHDRGEVHLMAASTAAHIVDSLKSSSGWHPRIEFAMHGEPTLHPDFEVLVAIFRKRLPPTAHLMMTSNGHGFVKDPTASVDGVLTHLNVLALDWYEGIKLVPRILASYRGKHRVLRYPQERQANPHRRRTPGEHDLVVVQDIETATKGTHSVLNNHCGCGAPPNESAAGKRCAKPFREMSIRWDGSVAICCNDWRGVFKCGNVHESSLEEIWNGPALRAARKKLYHGERTFAPCLGCDALSYRPGLLPDHKGLLTLPRATPYDEATIQKAISGKAYTLPVLRPWETE